MLTDQEWVKLWNKTGGRAAEFSKLTGISIRNVYARRVSLQNKLKIPLYAAGDNGNKVHKTDELARANSYLARVLVDGYVGRAVVFSDCHYWPGIGSSVAHRALLEVIKDIKPGLIIGNGDLFDGARVSRFPKNGWEDLPRIRDELDEAISRVTEIRHAHRRARLIRTVGNHCIRFDRYLAMNAGEMEGVQGFRLSDHMPEWQECISVFINGHTMVKHRFNGGIHAAYNNTLRAGTNIVTGHTHLLEVKPWSDYNGRRYGVQTGAIADVAGPQFGYTEDNPTPWCSGFAVLTFKEDGHLVMPDLCEVIDGVAWFRGERVT